MIVAAVENMAKKRSKPGKPKAERKPMVVQIRGSEEWKAWVESLAEGEGDTVSTFFARLARHYAKEKGLPDPPKR